MNRKELISALADKAGVSQTDADKVLDAFQDIVFDVVSSEGEKLTLPGFLAFEQSSRSARTGRNPQTGETIQIAAGAPPPGGGGLLSHVRSNKDHEVVARLSVRTCHNVMIVEG